MGTHHFDLVVSRAAPGHELGDVWWLDVWGMGGRGWLRLQFVRGLLRGLRRRGRRADCRLRRAPLIIAVSRVVRVRHGAGGGAVGGLGLQPPLQA